MTWSMPTSRIFWKPAPGRRAYQIVQRVELNEFPVKTDGFRYDPQTYLDVLNGVQPSAYARRSQLPGHPDRVECPAAYCHGVRLTKYGFLPSRMLDSTNRVMGGAGAFWCNSPPMTWSAGCARRFIVMGFSYERGVGEMLESFGHRSESLVSKVFNCQEFVAWAYKPGRVPATVGPTLNLFQQFISFDQIAPGKAGVGTIHYAPNSDRDYDWNNPRQVPSSCYDWYNFPGFAK